MSSTPRQASTADTTPLAPPEVALQGRALRARFSTPQRVLSWAPRRGGFVQADEVAWIGVRNAELPREVDPLALLDERLAEAGADDAVGMLTSRDLDRYVVSDAVHRGVLARCVATVGLSNALRIGDPPHEPTDMLAAPPSTTPYVGTINLLCWLSEPLDDAGLLEAMSLAVEARTAAVLEAGLPSTAATGMATGTGTDCVAVASPPAASATTYAGKHTVVGHLVGKVVRETIARGVADWIEEQQPLGGHA